MDQERLQRIARMEEIYDRCSEAVAVLQQAAQGYQNIRQELEELERYYESPLWMQDFFADREGKIPQTMKRGILTEDAIYDLLTDEAALMVQLRELSQEENK